MSTPTSAQAPPTPPPTGPGPSPAPRRRGGTAGALLRAMRPKQYLKNILVFAAPTAAGVLGESGALRDTMLAFVSFCLASSATYLLNDVGDRHVDARHPTKRHRPIASGEVPVGLALGWALVCLLASLGIAAAVNWRLFALIAGYKVLTVAYTFWLKHIPVVDIAVVATGFIVRAVAGGVAVDVTLSRWFLIVTSFGSLFMVAGKRYGEWNEIGEDRAGTRPALAAYTRDYLRYVWSMASAITIAGYCLWAFEHPTGDSGIPWWGLSIIPFVMGMMRYALLLEQGHGSAPEDVVLGDRTLQVFGVMWVALFVGSVYLN